MPIRNIVFDLGNVLVDFDPPAYLRSRGFDGTAAAELLRIVFAEAWPKGDAGDYLTIKAMRDDLLRSHPAKAKAIRRVLRPDCVRMHVLREDVSAYLHALKARGYRIYLLSNLAKYSHDYVRAYPFFDDLDGAVCSYQEHICKPDTRIYQILLERYGLSPQETVFLDDNPANTDAAFRCGLHGIVFTDLAAAKTQLESLLQNQKPPKGKEIIK